MPAGVPRLRWNTVQSKHLKLTHPKPQLRSEFHNLLEPWDRASCDALRDPCHVVSDIASAVPVPPLQGEEARNGPLAADWMTGSGSQLDASQTFASHSEREELKDIYV